MPMQYMEPELFMVTGRGVKVYNDYDEGHPGYALYWHYQVKSDDFETGYATFDIRDLATEIRQPAPTGASGAIKQLINAAERMFDFPLDVVLAITNICEEGAG